MFCRVLGQSATRRLFVSAGVVAALVGGAFAPVGATSSPAYIVVHNCQEEQAFVDGDPAAVAARLPQRYTAVRDPVSHAPVLFMRAERCSVQINGAASPATMASFGVVVQSPDGRGCASGVPVVGGGQGAMPPVCNWYTLRWFATSQPVVDWLQAGTPDFPAAYAPGLVFTLGGNDPTRGGAPFEFRAPAATQAPFAMHAITQQRPGTLIVRGGYWADTAAGTVKLAFSTDTLTSGSARGFVTAPPGTEVAALLGAPQRAYLPGYSALAAEQFSRGIYRKQVDAPAQDAHAFAGSCVVKGTVTFTPPATNVPQPLHYDYPAIGTCSGALDGRHIEKAGVRLPRSQTTVWKILRLFGCIVQ